MQFIQEFVGSVELGDQYLWEEVLERQPEEVRSFLLRTAVLDRFNASLCDAVTEAGTGDELLRRCERDNLFILPLVGQGAWYRYHHLFADALRERLSQTATDEEITDLHQRAAAWLEANGCFEDAIRHATAGRQWDHVIEMLEEVCAELFERDQIATLRHWLQGIPPTSWRPLRSSPSGSPGRRDARGAGPRQGPHCASPKRCGRRMAIAWVKRWCSSGMRPAPSGI